MQNVHSKKADFFKMHSFEIVEKSGQFYSRFRMFESSACSQFSWFGWYGLFPSLSRIYQYFLYAYIDNLWLEFKQSFYLCV